MIHIRHERIKKKKKLKKKETIRSLLSKRIYD